MKTTHIAKLGKFVVLFSLLIGLGFAGGTEAPEANSKENQSLTIHYIYSDGCPYCAHQEDFHEQLKEDYPQLEIIKYDITDSETIREIDRLENEHGVEVGRIATPLTFIEGEKFLGFNPSIEKDIMSKVESELGNSVERSEIDNESNQIQGDSEEAYIPYLGEIELSAYSIAFLAVILGLVDGLNVCSIGALLLVLGIVVKFDSRRKILAYGGLFILTTVAVYGGIIFIWYSLLESMAGYFSFLNLLLGITGIAGGIYFFKDFLNFYKHGPTCDATTNKYVSEFRGEVSDRLHSNSTSFSAVAGAIVLFAAGITIVEIPCSVALPLVFTGVLADAALGPVAYTLYILLYLLMYMLIELVIFVIAVFTKDLWYGPDKAVTWTTLLASLILFLLGLYYLPFIPLGL